MKNGRRLGVDFGDVRVGVAMSDSSGLLASPLLTINNEGVDRVVKAMVNLIEENEIVTVYLGLPIHLSGGEGSASNKVREFALILQKSLPARVILRLIDERLTTAQAEREAMSAGKKVNREIIDQLAAVVILENALHAERIHGDWAGKPVLEI
jgi:putative Holliday junction resolvase